MPLRYGRRNFRHQATVVGVKLALQCCAFFFAARSSVTNVSRDYCAMANIPLGNVQVLLS